MVEITVTVTLKSPLSIGSGAQQGTLAQRGLLKDHTGWPYIPASTLKGRLRHAVEQIVSATDNRQTVLDPHAHRVRHANDIVTHLFGAPWAPGQVVFADLHLSGPPAVMTYRRRRPAFPLTTQRTQVSINRRRGVAQDERLFSTELFWPGIPLEFQGCLQGALSPADAAWLAAGLAWLPALGRSKSSGLGWIKVETETRIDGQLWTLADLRRALQESLL